MQCRFKPQLPRGIALRQSYSAIIHRDQETDGGLLEVLGDQSQESIEEEKCLIPLGGTLPTIPQNVLGMGSTSGIVHPSTGYMVPELSYHLQQ